MKFEAMSKRNLTGGRERKKSQNNWQGGERNYNFNEVDDFGTNNFTAAAS